MTELLEIEFDGSNDYQKLLTKIEWIVNYLIEKDLERLFWMLYRIDVSEQKIKNTLDLSGPDNASLAIATLVLEREIEKAKTRKSYKSSKTNETDPMDQEERW